MKPTALLVNTSRGAVVNEKALTTALEQKWITGACLDVLEQEPPGLDDPLFSLDNVIITPHIAGVTKEARERIVIQTARNIAEVLQGKLPPGRFIVNPDVLE
jgi:phosphoglycerate dehydrogenase-like enzyme